MSKFHEKFGDKAVIFMEDSDFDDAGNFLKSMNGKSMILMIGASFCGYCTEKGAPAFNAFAMQNSVKEDKDKSKVITAVVYADGDPSEQQLAKRFGAILGKRGIPLYIFFGSDKKIRSHQVGALELQQLEDFVNKNLS